MAVGVVIEVPAIAAAIIVLGWFGQAPSDVTFMEAARLTVVFAGLAALLTAGGIGRLAAHAAVAGGRRRAAFVAARAHAFAGAGLVMIARVPHGQLPDDPWAWLPIPIAGLIAGALIGAVIGVVCGGVSSVGLADVWSIARRPSAVIKNLVNPEDFVKLGAALKSRTTNWFEGMFTTAPPPPASTAELADVPPTAEARAEPTPARAEPTPAPLEPTPARAESTNASLEPTPAPTTDTDAKDP